MEKRIERQVTLDDLTIFDHEIDIEDKQAMECPKILYIISLCLNIAINILMLINLISDEFEIEIVFGCFISFVCYFFSISYVFFPKAKITRMKITKIMLVIFCICTGVYVFASIVIAFIFEFFSDDSRKDSEGVWRFYYIYLFLLIIIPVFHCIMIVIIWRQRVRIAWQMEDDMNNLDYDSYLLTQSNNNLSSYKGTRLSYDSDQKEINSQNRPLIPKTAHPNNKSDV